MSRDKPSPMVIGGWTIFAHPLFLDQLEVLTRQVEALKQKNPVGFVKKNATKRLAAIAKLAFDVIPQNPAHPDFRQGNTLGEEHKHWYRAKFFQQYRLFFRFHAASKLIVYAWVNDEGQQPFAAYPSGHADHLESALTCLSAPWAERLSQMAAASAASFLPRLPLMQ